MNSYLTRIIADIANLLAHLEKAICRQFHLTLLARVSSIMTPLETFLTCLGCVGIDSLLLQSTLCNISVPTVKLLVSHVLQQSYIEKVRQIRARQHT